MSEPPESDENLGPAEQALSEHLTVLRDNPPMPEATLVPKVVTTARWQRALSRPLFVIGSLAQAIAEGVGILFAPVNRR
jgi:hypothetical protein